MKKARMVVVVMIAVSLMSSPIMAVTPYTITDIGTYALGLNESGQVVGYMPNNNSLHEAFLWSMADGLSSLGTRGTDPASSANAINDNGHVAGTSWPEPYGWGRTFLWTESDGMNDIGTLGGDVANGNDINNYGQIAGSSSLTGSTTVYPFLWSEADGMDILVADEGWANSINDSGEIVGTADTDGDRYAFHWSEITGAVELDSFGGISGAGDINNSGQIVGAARYATGDYHACLWEEGVIIDLGLFDGSDRTTAAAINDLGDIVGRASFSSGQNQALLWEGGENPINLNTMLLNAFPEWDYLSDATDINNQGQIVGRGYIDGIAHGFLLTPNTDPAVVPAPYPYPVVPAPSAILLGSIGIGCVRWLRRRRAL